jgi:hypothetical protein
MAVICKRTFIGGFESSRKKKTGEIFWANIWVWGWMRLKRFWLNSHYSGSKLSNEAPELWFTLRFDFPRIQRNRILSESTAMGKVSRPPQLFHHFHLLSLVSKVFSVPRAELTTLRSMSFMSFAQIQIISSHQFESAISLIFPRILRNALKSSSLSIDFYGIVHRYVSSMASCQPLFALASWRHDMVVQSIHESSRIFAFPFRILRPLHFKPAYTRWSFSASNSRLRTLNSEERENFLLSAKENPKSNYNHMSLCMQLRRCRIISCRFRGNHWVCEASHCTGERNLRLRDSICLRPALWRNENNSDSMEYVNHFAESFVNLTLTEKETNKIRLRPGNNNWVVLMGRSNSKGSWTALSCVSSCIS